MKVHIGCGKRHLPGWVHVDKDDFEHIDHRCDINNLNFIENDVADEAYSCHALEYFDRFEAVDVLKEWKRILKPGGTLRLAVPDIDGLIEVYKKTGDLTKSLGPMYGRMEIDIDGERQYIYHRTVWNFDLLKETLEKAGFSDVRRWDWREFFPEGYDDYARAYVPHMDFENGTLISLNVVATADK